MTRVQVRSYQDLISWQHAMRLTLACYKVAKTMPVEERFGLASQLRRAAVSVPSNIAEGHGRTALGDYLRSLSIARGSLMEVETQLLVARDLAYGKPAHIDAALDLASQTGRLLNGLIGSLGQDSKPRGRGPGVGGQPTNREGSPGTPPLA